MSALDCRNAPSRKSVPPESEYYVILVVFKLRQRSAQIRPLFGFEPLGEFGSGCTSVGAVIKQQKYSIAGCPILRALGFCEGWDSMLHPPHSQDNLNRTRTDHKRKAL